MCSLNFTAQLKLVYILVAQGPSTYLYHQLDSLHSCICWNFKWFKRSLKGYENPHFLKKKTKPQTPQLFSNILLDRWKNSNLQLMTTMVSRGSCYCPASRWVEKCEETSPTVSQYQATQQLHWRKCFSAEGSSQQPPCSHITETSELDNNWGKCEQHSNM